MNQIWLDIRYALRGFVRSPLFTLIAVCSLAFGIGANAAIFSLLDQVILRYLPVKNPGALVQFKMRGQHYGNNWGMNAISYPMYRDFRDHNQVFSGMFCRFPTSTSLGYGNRTERVSAELVSGNYFPVLGVTAAGGRVLTAKDDLFENASPVVVLSYSYWQNRFAGNASIIGKSLVINGHNLTVVGVAQPGFNGMEVGDPIKLFIPIKMKPQIMPLPRGMDDRRWRWVNAYGRLKPGITRQQAQASLQPFMHSMLELEVKEPAFRNASNYTRQQFLKCWMELLPGGGGRSYLREQMTKPLWVLLGITGMVLSLACANLANLLLARATARTKEMAIRLAIGAGRRALIRQLLTESLLLSLTGAVIGVVLAYVADRILLGMYLPVENPLDAAFSPIPDLRVLAFTFGLTLLTTIVFGLVPALQSSRSDVADTLKAQAGSVVGGSHVGIRKALVAAQVGLSLLLLIGAGLFSRTLSNLRDLGPGFSPENLVGFRVDPTLNGYDATRTKLFYRQLTDSLLALPGVRLAAYSAMRILEEDEWDSSMTAEGYAAKPGQHPEPYMNAISPNYFVTLGVPLLAGRDFTAKDDKNQQHGDKPDNFVPTTVIINEKFAKKYFSGRNPIGLHLGYGSDPNTRTDMEIIGVVKDIKYTNLRDEIPPQAFVPIAADRNPYGVVMYMRTTEDPHALMSLVRQKVHALDPNLPVYDIRTTDEQIRRSLRNERLIASLSSLFGALATLLAIMGLYGVLAYMVSRKTREIGIRMALGAIRGNVIWMVMKEMLVLVGIGIVIGLPTAVGLSSLVRNQLYGLAPHDPTTLMLATASLLMIACVAGFIPALRASRIDPTRALRYE
ncbi:MAG TPA: ABC transporter permease [Bryobacteraceae bacterium]|nr:ABC transporter permease [Bryobacteraceae bacterium]